MRAEFTYQGSFARLFICLYRRHSQVAAFERRLPLFQLEEEGERQLLICSCDLVPPRLDPTRLVVVCEVVVVVVFSGEDS